MSRTAKAPLLVIRFELTPEQSNHILEILENDAAEIGSESCDSMTIRNIMRAQAMSQNGIVNGVVRVACADCTQSFQMPNELLKNIWMDTSQEFFCPFCDHNCEHPRCVKCRMQHLNQH